MMNMLMGPNVEERKQFIMKNVDFQIFVNKEDYSGRFY